MKTKRPVDLTPMTPADYSGDTREAAMTCPHCGVESDRVDIEFREHQFPRICELIAHVAQGFGADHPERLCGACFRRLVVLLGPYIETVN